MKNSYSHIFKSLKLFLIAAFLFFKISSYSQTLVFDTLCSGLSYTLPSGLVVDSAGLYIDTIKDFSGGDSIIHTSLTYTSAINTTQYITFCDSTGNSNNVKDTLSAMGGCDSIVTYIITYVPTLNLSASVQIQNPTTGVLLASSTVPFVTYNWSGPCIVAGGTTSSPIVNCAGSYTVTITDPQTGCTNTAVTTMPIYTGVYEQKSIGAIAIYPNPNNGVFTFSNIEKESNIEVYDSFGKIIYQTIVNASFQEIDLFNYAKGVYFYRVIFPNRDFQSSGKIVVK